MAHVEQFASHVEQFATHAEQGAFETKLKTLSCLQPIQRRTHARRAKRTAMRINHGSADIRVPK